MSTPHSTPLMPGMPLVRLMAVACGLAVANIYYAQPLLALLSRDYGLGSGTASLIVTITQIGYAAGLIFLVPLGDQVDRRRLTALLAAATGGALVIAAISPGIGVFLAASFLIGLGAVCAQVMVPMAAHLAADHARGAVVGQVMSGLLIGILLARAFSGVLADVAGWRAVFGVAAVAMFLLAVVLYRALPDEDTPPTWRSYRATLASTAALLAEEPVLRRRIVYGGCGFAGFTMVWTALAFLLSAPPYQYGETVIGLFSLLGAAGAAGANVAGRLHDRGLGQRAVGGFMIAAIVAFVLMGLFGQYLAVVVVGLLLMDLGVQGVQILNQSALYALRPDARSRITTAYLGCFFLAGAIGSILAGTSYALGGWPAAMAVAGLLEAGAFIFWLSEPRTGTPSVG